jgi:hypothetical protein
VLWSVAALPQVGLVVLCCFGVLLCGCACARLGGGVLFQIVLFAGFVGSAVSVFFRGGLLLAELFVGVLSLWPAGVVLVVFFSVGGCASWRCVCCCRGLPLLVLLLWLSVGLLCLGLWSLVGCFLLGFAVGLGCLFCESVCGVPVVAVEFCPLSGCHSRFVVVRGYCCCLAFVPLLLCLLVGSLCLGPWLLVGCFLLGFAVGLWCLVCVAVCGVPFVTVGLSPVSGCRSRFVVVRGYCFCFCLAVVPSAVVPPGVGWWCWLSSPRRMRCVLLVCRVV